MKKGLVIFLGVIIVIVIVAVIAMISFNKQYQDLLKEVDMEYSEIDNIDLTQINDGEYSARFGKIPVIADLKVKVEDNRIVSITMVEQSSGPGYEALETIDRIIEKQQPKVDVVTGATTSSKVIMIAVKKALNQE
ncbi:MAG: FMN-binding protein [Candidatus Marinimicrobia bacterium]|nr:FMN-binding protein [Candidatus Neomarinimicrobiota bacterium]